MARGVPDGSRGYVAPPSAVPALRRPDRVAPPLVTGRATVARGRGARAVHRTRRRPAGKKAGHLRPAGRGDLWVVVSTGLELVAPSVGSVSSRGRRGRVFRRPGQAIE